MKNRNMPIRPDVTAPRAGTPRATTRPTQIAPERARPLIPRAAGPGAVSRAGTGVVREQMTTPRKRRAY